MAFYRGQQGSVKFDDAGSTPAAISSTRSWSLTVEKESLDATALGDTYRANVGGLISGSGTCEVLYTASSSDETNVFIERANAATDEGGAAFAAIERVPLAHDMDGPGLAGFDLRGQRHRMPESTQILATRRTRSDPGQLFVGIGREPDLVTAKGGGARVLGNH